MTGVPPRKYNDLPVTLIFTPESIRGAWRKAERPEQYNSWSIRLFVVRSDDVRRCAVFFGCVFDD